jgi:phage terminase large subunit-like protein
MAAVAQRLQAAGAPMREYAQTAGNLTAMGSNLYELIKGRGLVAYPDDALRLAVSRAIAVETGRGWRITKEKSAHKIDVVVALAMAAHAAVHFRWDENVPIVSPAVINADGSVTTPSGRPIGPQQQGYDERASSAWRNYVRPDGSISMTPMGGGGWPW